MNNLATEVLGIINLIDFRLINTEDIENYPIGFFLEDFIKLNLSEDDFRVLLKFLLKKGLLNNINTTDEDFEIEPGRKIDYRIYPEQFPGIFVVEINKNYNTLKNQLLRELKNESNNSKINLSDFEVIFNDTKPALLIGDKECPLPPFKNEHYLCREMFKIPKNEFIDWSLISERMDKSENIKMRSIQDALYALNDRVKEIIGTDDNMLSWQNKSIKRNY
jgi:hypothetical protein